MIAPRPIGQVVGVHLDERFVVDGILDVAALQPVARCGYKADYTVLDRVFHMERPAHDPSLPAENRRWV